MRWRAGLTGDERSEVVTVVAMRNSRVTYRQAIEIFDALAAEWREEQAQAARVLPPVGAICEALTTLAAAAPDAYARACGRAAGALVSGNDVATIDAYGDLIINSLSKCSREWRVNAHGCTCRAKSGACWHTALRDAVVMVKDEEDSHGQD